MRKLLFFIESIALMKKALACCGEALQTLQVPCFKTCLISGGRGFSASVLLFHMPAETQIGSYGSKRGKSEQGKALGLETPTDAAGGQPSHLFWNRLLIFATLHTKLLLKSSPFILTFKALHYVTQGRPSFLQWWGFPAGSKTTKASPKEANSSVRILKCQCFAMSLPTGVLVCT